MTGPGPNRRLSDRASFANFSASTSPSLFLCLPNDYTTTTTGAAFVKAQCILLPVPSTSCPPACLPGLAYLLYNTATAALSQNVLSVLNAFRTIIYRFVLISAYLCHRLHRFEQCITAGFAGGTNTCSPKARSQRRRHQQRGLWQKRERDERNHLWGERKGRDILLLAVPPPRKRAPFLTIMDLSEIPKLENCNSPPITRDEEEGEEEEDV